MDVPATSEALDAINAARRVAKRAALLKRAQGGGWRGRLTLLLPLLVLGTFAVAKMDEVPVSIACVVGMVVWTSVTLERVVDFRMAALLELMSLETD